MFGFRWVLPWVWGAGYGTTPVPPAAIGPYWVNNYQMIGPRCYALVVRPIQVIPGRIWSDDPTLQVFAWDNED